MDKKLHRELRKLQTSYNPINMDQFQHSSSQNDWDDEPPPSNVTRASGSTENAPFSLSQVNQLIQSSSQELHEIIIATNINRDKEMEVLRINQNKTNENIDKILQHLTLNVNSSNSSPNPLTSTETDNATQTNTNANESNIAQLLTQALSRIPNAMNIKHGKFNPQRHTATSHIASIERYFTAHGYTENQFLSLVPETLDNESKLWWDLHHENLHNWNEFKTAFINRYDSWFETNER